MMASLVKACGLTAVIVWSLYQFWLQSSAPSGCIISGGNLGRFENVHISEMESKLALKYRLHRYNKYSDTNSRLVLMMPGHCGGHGQFTRLAHKLASLGYTVYAVDHGGEYSGLHGESVMEEAEFARDAIKYMQQRSGNGKVTVMGHSMGGVAAMAIELVERGLVDRVVTFATSHRAPPISLCPKLHHIYSQLRNFNIMVISVVNSERDLMVDPALSITRGVNVFVERFGCRPDHISILTCPCVVDNIEQIISVQESGKITTRVQPSNWFAVMFRRFGVMMIAVGVQLCMVEYLVDLVCHRQTTILLDSSVIGLFGLVYTIYGYTFKNTLSLGLWAMACLGPNYLVLGVLSQLSRLLRRWPKRDRSINHDSFGVLLTVTLITLFAPFPYAFLILNLMIMATVFRQHTDPQVAPFQVLFYLQIINAPSLLVWVHGVSRGWTSFADVDMLRTVPFALFAYLLHSGRVEYCQRVAVPLSVLFTITAVWFSEKETFRLGDLFSVYLILQLASTKIALKLGAKGDTGALDGGQEAM